MRLGAAIAFHDAGFLVFLGPVSNRWRCLSGCVRWLAWFSVCVTQAGVIACYSLHAKIQLAAPAIPLFVLCLQN
ncbi:hypothetical protein BD410DRAFT_286833 [Rickenella mellea]|uniref:Uncharacterized protein n=1 Tax=Rickenella mellea TaxID=50990 RepID=A0A4Y7Q1Z9_9AGAM|nr:hypothetical protein BD410DRAFT_286833 [Rickenella mellea]